MTLLVIEGAAPKRAIDEMCYLGDARIKYPRCQFRLPDEICTYDLMREKTGGIILRSVIPRSEVRVCAGTTRSCYLLIQSEQIEVLDRWIGSTRIEMARTDSGWQVRISVKQGHPITAKAGKLFSLMQSLRSEVIEI